MIGNFISFIRHYLLDLMRVTPRDANYTRPGSRFCILRPELITAFCQVCSCGQNNLVITGLFLHVHSFLFFNGEGRSCGKVEE
jgi:hypothetical protein